MYVSCFCCFAFVFVLLCVGVLCVCLAAVFCVYVCVACVCVFDCVSNSLPTCFSAYKHFAEFYLAFISYVAILFSCKWVLLMVAVAFILYTICIVFINTFTLWRKAWQPEQVRSKGQATKKQSTTTCTKLLLFYFMAI